MNYTWSHSLGIAAQNGIQGMNGQLYFTDRNFRLNCSAAGVSAPFS